MVTRCAGKLKACNLACLLQLQSYPAAAPVTKHAIAEPPAAPHAADRVFSTAKPAKMLQIVLLGDSG